MNNIDIIKSSYKIPIPSNLNSVFGEDYLAKHIYTLLLLRTRISAGAVKSAGKVYTLKRG